MTADMWKNVIWLDETKIKFLFWLTGNAIACGKAKTEQHHEQTFLMNKHGGDSFLVKRRFVFREFTPRLENPAAITHLCDCIERCFRSYSSENLKQMPAIHSNSYIFLLAFFKTMKAVYALSFSSQIYIKRKNTQVFHCKFQELGKPRKYCI